VVGAGDDVSEGTRRRGAASLVIASDRLPNDEWQDATTGVTVLRDDPVSVALSSACSSFGGVWIGRAGGPDAGRVNTHELAIDATTLSDYQSHTGQTMWPIYHDLVRPAAHHPQWREAFRAVNQAFASTIAQQAAPHATVWLHDYQLHLVPTLLRRRRPDLHLGFYLTTPFPPLDLIQQTPMYRNLIGGLLGADVVGFQGVQSAENFLRVSAGLPTPDSEYERILAADAVDVGVYPTSVDAVTIDQIARRPDVQSRAADIRAKLGNPQVVVLALDPPTPAAGVGNRLRALRTMFDDGMLRPDRVGVVQVVVGPPDDGGQSGSAAEPTAMTEVHNEIAREVARINGQFAVVGRPCLHYLKAMPDLQDRVALYLAADVFMATPLREGATLNALEFVAACKPDSALVLSEFTGTATVLPEAFLVNPYDEHHLRTSLLAAVSAGRLERLHRMNSMRAYVAAYDTHTWARLFLDTIQSRGDLRNTGRRAQFESLEQLGPIWSFDKPRHSSTRRLRPTDVGRPR
jgi:trehalose 6-phosphate synthase